MHSNTVTVIIPTYNRRQCLGRALESVYLQSSVRLEIIVIDDGSTDDTSNWLEQHHPTVKCIKQGNHGVSHARNRGIDQATSEWIALLDSDDAWQPNKLQAQLSALAETQHRLCHTNEIWIRDGQRVNVMQKYKKHHGNIFPHCLPLCCISPSSALIHSSVFTEIGHFDESLPACEDYDFWLRYCARHPVTLVEDALTVKYGGHADQLSRSHWGMDRFQVRALSKLLSSQVLTAHDTTLTRAALQRKLRILFKGAIKHGNIELQEQCLGLASQHQLSRLKEC